MDYLSSIKESFPIAAFTESLWLVVNVIFFSFINIGKPRIRAVILYILNIIIIIMIRNAAGHITGLFCLFLSNIAYCAFSSNRKKLSTRFFLGIISCILLLASESIAAVLLMKFNILDLKTIAAYDTKENNIYQTTMMSSMSIVMMFISVLISFFYSGKNSAKLNILMLFAPFQQLIIIFFLNMMISHNHSVLGDPVISTLYILAAAFGMGMNIITLRIADKINQKQIEQQKNKFLEYYSKANAEYTARTENSLHEIRKIRHDFNNHLQVIKTLIDTDDVKNASDMISQLEEKYSGTEIHRYSENHILDIILSSTADMCSKNNIKFTCECSIPKETEHQIDICSIVSNMLQNAYEAVLQNTENKTIHFSASFQNSMIFLKCENSTEKPLKQKGSKILTTKSDNQNHGFGIEIIEHTAALYNGNVIIEHDDSLFSILVQLNMKTK